MRDRASRELRYLCQQGVDAVGSNREATRRIYRVGTISLGGEQHHRSRFQKTQQHLAALNHRRLDLNDLRDVCRVERDAVLVSGAGLEHERTVGELDLASRCVAPDQRVPDHFGDGRGESITGAHAPCAEKRPRCAVGIAQTTVDAHTHHGERCTFEQRLRTCRDAAPGVRTTLPHCHRVVRTASDD
jgi:hypothetical protein